MTAGHVLPPRSLLRRAVFFVKSYLVPPASHPHKTTVTMAASEEAPQVAPKLSDVAHVPIPRRGADYRGKVVLAPMVRSGELPSRLLALKYGADLVWGPETIDRSMIGTTQHTNPRTGCIEWTRHANNNAKGVEPKQSVIYRIDPARESDKLIYQIGTNNPDRAVEAAALVAPYVSGIDVNAGCPKPFSTSGGMGAALLRTPDLLCSILRALVEKVGGPHEIGISVKIRLLETPELTSSLVNALCKTGITGLTIHCRTTPMRPRERAIRQQLRMIGDICRSHGVACLMNGDVTSREEGLALADEYGVNGAMIATAAEANSSVFRSKDDGGIAPWYDVVKQYLELAMSVENKWGNTKFLLSQLMPGKDGRYQKIQQSRSHVEALEILSIEDTKMVEAAKEIDHLLGLDAPKITKADLKRANKQQNKENQVRALEKKRQREVSDADGAQDEARSKKQKAEIAADNAGFEGVGQGAMAVAA